MFCGAVYAKLHFANPGKTGIAYFRQQKFVTNHHYRKEKYCLNCGAEVSDKYCSRCGQANVEHKESFFISSVIFLLISPISIQRFLSRYKT
jgi:hypothetical protein